MCSVSVLHQYWKDNTQPAQWTKPMLTEYQEVIRRLDKLDEALGQKDCIDPAKAAWMREVEARIATLEDA
jgi:hypothetical protein